jgi:hypothetical protein
VNLLGRERHECAACAPTASVAGLGCAGFTTDAQPFFKRTLQRYIDDMKLYVENVRPGPKQTYQAPASADSLVAYGGPPPRATAYLLTWCWQPAIGPQGGTIVNNHFRRGSRTDIAA